MKMLTLDLLFAFIEMGHVDAAKLDLNQQAIVIG
jgi:hypothetical protein